MNIQVSENWRIRTDTQQYIVEKLPDTGKDWWSPVGYYGTLQGALNGLYERRLLLSEAQTLREAIQDAKSLHREIQDALDANFKIPGGNRDATASSV